MAKKGKEIFLTLLVSVTQRFFSSNKASYGTLLLPPDIDLH